MHLNKLLFYFYRTGGPWLVSDMRRGESMLDIDITIQDEVERGIESEGSNLSGVSACCSWIETDIDSLSDQQKSKFSKSFLKK